MWYSYFMDRIITEDNLNIVKKFYLAITRIFFTFLILILCYWFISPSLLNNEWTTYERSAFSYDRYRTPCEEIKKQDPSKLLFTDADTKYQNGFLNFEFGGTYLKKKLGMYSYNYFDHFDAGEKICSVERTRKIFINGTLLPMIFTSLIIFIGWNFLVKKGCLKSSFVLVILFVPILILVYLLIFPFPDLVRF